MATIVHVSDLHFGWPYVEEVGEAVLRTIDDERPDAVVISGDLVQRGDFISLWEQARAFVERLPRPRLIVPGNHDIPLFNPFLRAFSPLERYRAYIHPELDPVLSVPGATIVGINSARPWLIDQGHVAVWQIERARRAFAEAPPGDLRAVAIHHPIVPQPNTGIKRQHVFGHRRAVRGLAEAGAEVVLCGHLHFPTALNLVDLIAAGAGVVMAQAGTATSKRLRPRSGTREQAFNVVRAGPEELSIEAWHFLGGRFEPAKTTKFKRRRAVGAAGCP